MNALFLMLKVVNLRFSFLKCKYQNRLIFKNNHYVHTPNANVADHSAGTQDKLHESKAGQVSVKFVLTASTEKFCLWLIWSVLPFQLHRVFVFVIATRRE